MALDGKLLARARERLERIRADNESERERRQARTWAGIPRLREIDGQLRRLLGEVIGLTLRRDGEARAALEAVQARSEALQREKAALLSENGLPPDYLDEIYSCRLCRDRGFDAGGKPCRCLLELYRREQARELSSLLKLGADDFSQFDLNYYCAETDPRYGISPREAMGMVLSTCRQYAEDFGNGSRSMLLRGGTGLGKTFLSACIARRAADRGFSVVYDTAVSAFEAFETSKFHREGPGAEDAADKCSRILSCELMILDDLGTEMTTQFTQSALYTIVNTRLCAQRPTIISTNLSAEEMSARYSAQIMSRIDGEYDTLLFLGRDVRAVKKEQRYR